MFKRQKEKQAKELILTIKLCACEAINGEYGNNFVMIDDIFHDFLTKNMNKLMDDNNNNYYIMKLHIFAHKLFGNSNKKKLKNNYLLFLCQNKLTNLKNNWFIAKYNGTDTDIELMYYVNDRISSSQYFAPITGWKPYNNDTLKDEKAITIHLFDTNEKNLDQHLVVFNNRYKYTSRWGGANNLHSNIIKKYKRKDVADKYSVFKLSRDFDNIYFKSIKPAAIEDVRWFSNAHSWYKHLPITGCKYIIYPFYNGMTRGYGGKMRYEFEIRWHCSPVNVKNENKIFSMFQKDVANIIKKYGQIKFNRAYCGVNRCIVDGNNEYGIGRYPKSPEIYKNEHSFTLVESELQIEHAVRCAFKIYDEVIKLFDFWKLCVLNYWLRMNDIGYIVSGIKDIVNKFIFLQFEKFAFVKSEIFLWGNYETHRYFHRLFEDVERNYVIESLHKLWSEYWVYGADLFKVTDENLIKCKMDNKNDRLLFLNEVSNLYDETTLNKYIKYSSKKVKNQEEVRKLLNVDFKQFKENGNKVNFYNNLNINDQQAIDIFMELHQKFMLPLRSKKQNDWY